MARLKIIAARFTLMIWGILFTMNTILAQSPTDIDTRRKDPRPFTAIDYLIYIGFPILMVILVIWYRNYRKKQEENKDLTEHNQE